MNLTVTGPILSTVSFQYVIIWLNLHPFKSGLNSRLISKLHNGAHESGNASLHDELIDPELEDYWNVMKS